MVDDGYELETALRRAARAHGVNLQQARPPIEALRAAIRDYRELFRPQQSALLQQQRGLAMQAMQALAEFRPRLVGALVHGDGPLDAIRLMVYADTTEQLMLYMADRQMPWQATEVTLHYSGGRRARQPALGFLAGETRVELVVLNEQSHSDPPRDPITGGRLEMLGIDELDALIHRSPA
ncbi:MAG: hypothetical protein WBM59_11415 [Sedimenticolaceae bacterium]